MRILRLRRHNQVVMQDADVLIASFGERAYELARTKSRQARLDPDSNPDRPRGHWDKVRREIVRRTGRDTRLDPATRYLES